MKLSKRACPERSQGACPERSRRGFTLIEILLAVTIIILMTSLILVSISNARKKGRDSKRLADLSRIQLALDMYKDTYNSYPTTLTIAWAEAAPTSTIATSLATYISPMPQDPINNTGDNYKYMIVRGSTAGGYWIHALFENPDNIPAGYILGTKCYYIWGGTATSTVPVAAPAPSYCS